MPDVRTLEEAVALLRPVDQIGFGLGLTATTKTTDCMCSWGNSCNPAAGVCNLDNDITRDQNVSSGPVGPGPTQAPMICPGTSENEKTTFQTAFASGL